MAAGNQTGMLVDDEAEMAWACQRRSEIDPVRCREAILDRCDVRCVALGYERIYRNLSAAGKKPLRPALTIDGPEMDHVLVPRVVERAPVTY